MCLVKCLVTLLRVTWSLRVMVAKKNSHNVTKAQSCTKKIVYKLNKKEGIAYNLNAYNCASV